MHFGEFSDLPLHLILRALHRSHACEILVLPLEGFLMMFQKEDEALVSQAESDVGADEPEVSEDDDEADVDVDNLASSMLPPACSCGSPQLFSHGAESAVVVSVVMCVFQVERAVLLLAIKEGVTTVGEGVCLARFSWSEVGTETHKSKG